MGMSNRTSCVNRSDKTDITVTKINERLISF